MSNSARNLTDVELQRRLRTLAELLAWDHVSDQVERVARLRFDEARAELVRRRP